MQYNTFIAIKRNRTLSKYSRSAYFSKKADDVGLQGEHWSKRNNLVAVICNGIEKVLYSAYFPLFYIFFCIFYKIDCWSVSEKEQVRFFYCRFCSKQLDKCKCRAPPSACCKVHLDRWKKEK